MRMACSATFNEPSKTLHFKSERPRGADNCAGQPAMTRLTVFADSGRLMLTGSAAEMARFLRERYPDGRTSFTPPTATVHLLGQTTKEALCWLATSSANPPLTRSVAIFSPSKGVRRPSFRDGFFQCVEGRPAAACDECVLDLPPRRQAAHREMRTEAACLRRQCDRLSAGQRQTARGNPGSPTTPGRHVADVTDPVPATPAVCQKPGILQAGAHHAEVLTARRPFWTAAAAPYRKRRASDVHLRHRLPKRLAECEALVQVTLRTSASQLDRLMKLGIAHRHGCATICVIQEFSWRPTLAYPHDAGQRQQAGSPAPGNNSSAGSANFVTGARP